MILNNKTTAFNIKCWVYELFVVLRVHIFNGSMVIKHIIKASSSVEQFVPASSRYSSWVWQHFDFYKEEYDGPVKRDRTCCKQCNELLANTQGNTPYIMRHLQRKHAIKVVKIGLMVLVQQPTS